MPVLRRMTPTVAAALLLSAALQASAGTPLPDAPHVVVSGEGSVSAAPDQVRIKLSVEARSPQPAQAKATVDRAVNGFLDVLKRHGVATDDVQASALSLTEDFEYDERGRRTPQGHLATRSVDVRLRRVDGFNAVLDEGLAAGMTRIDGISFESGRADALRMQARSQAATQSRERAEELARAYGARLGPVYSINSVGSGMASQYGASLDRITVTGSSVPAPPARYLQPSIEFNERVQVVFRLQP